jgi:adenylate kinase
VPDDVVVGIISDRIEQPDARKGFILDGFPRTVPQARALDELLKKKHLKLDAVVELRVNESALLERVEKRVAETRSRGEEVRSDDTPEVLSKRLASYRAQTEPLVHYYSDQRKLITVDGMMTIGNVTSAIDRMLDYLGMGNPEPAKKTSSKEKAAKKTSKKASKKSSKKMAKKAKKPSKAARKASKGAKKASKKTNKKAKKAKSKKSRR